MSDKKKITWQALAFMAFSTVWGFGNVTNGFVYFNGIQVTLSWILMFALYFVPYALMVGELGSAFKNEGGGVSSWLNKTMGAKVAYYAGFTYWACHITYIASKGSGSLKALSWAIFRNAETYDSLPTLGVQLATLAVFLLGCFIASRGLNPLKKLLTLAGTTMFVMSLLYIVMMFAAPAINPGATFVSMDLSMKSLIPNFNVAYFTSLSILVFAVGGCEKISPYVNKVENPSKGFPKGMISLAIMVVVCAILGTFAMGMMFDPAVINESTESFNSYAANGSYWAFQKLGEYWHVGDFFLIIYAICNLISQFAILVLSIDAPLRMLLDNDDTRQFIPSKLQKKNKYGVYSNGILLVAILSGAIILIQSVVPGAAAVLQQLTKLNSVCMPLRYLWVFVAYLALRKAYDKIPAEYRFVKNQGVAKFFGGWCFLITAASCILGMYSDDLFTFALNVITPVILTALGLIMPQIAKREQKKA
ncbi:amino acid permease [Bariatricus sp. HCP3S3_E12]|uniref:amino acid permease n=1 Tax=Bariatricus sp. HCP3S3_E12 TaxID=3438906 RepID=UPI002A7DD171|nr:amino acid permease [bacterium]MDD7143670.1 amino acid permease [bacterium]MDY2885790.1 amino acid permease [Bariatricus sp.]MDY5456222.1 amino acid permease [Bariatricus sp.]